MSNNATKNSDIKEIGLSLSTNSRDNFNKEKFLNTSPDSNLFLSIIPHNSSVERITRAQQRFIDVKNYVISSENNENNKKVNICFRSQDAMYVRVRDTYDITQSQMYWVGIDSGSGKTTDNLLLLPNKEISLSIKTNVGSLTADIPPSLNSILNTGPSIFLNRSIEETNTFLFESVKKSHNIQSSDKHNIMFSDKMTLNEIYYNTNKSVYDLIRGDIFTSICNECILNLPIEKQKEFIKHTVFKLKEDDDNSYVLMCNEKSFKAIIIPEKVDFKDNFTVSLCQNKPYKLLIKGIAFGGLDCMADLEYRTAHTNGIGYAFCLPIKGVLKFTKEEIRRHHV